MTNTVIKTSITGLLVFAFCTAGIVKITGKMAPQVHQQMKRDFVELARVHPLKVWFARNVNPEMYRIIIGYLEVVCALLLYAGPRPLKLASTAILLIIMVMMMQGLYWLGKPAILFTPATVCSILLVLNLMMLLGETPPRKESDRQHRE
ncbi:Transmembrane protein 35B [Desmophyllum pertusum]|uniref:Transmembrane protein 35B n=2 Tax=Desmophyllum pertusum TaxID=174260 RepID=A0A9W9ZQ30_9CNID|nr:Transmembrane protein 35B [Desmophyllum pertusum]